MFAVVYLNDMQKHIVVPREFIFGISMQNLLNYGKNRHIQYKIYWSKNAFPDGEIPISDIKVNFDLDYCHSFPPDDRDECCYRGHIKYFFESFDEAKAYCEKFRPQMPAVYNTAQLNDTFTQNLNASDVALQADQTNDVLQAEEEQVQNTNGIENQANAELDAPQSARLNDTSTQNLNASDVALQADQTNGVLQAKEKQVQNTNGIENQAETELDIPQIEQNEATSNDNEQHPEELSRFEQQIDIKQPLENVALNTSETAAVNDIFDETNNNIQTNTEHQQVAGEYIFVSPGGTSKVIRVVDEDCEFVFEMGSDPFKPTEIGYQVKLNDPLSGNIPFKENANKDRAYLIPTENGSREVTFAACIVNGLIALNKPERREDQSKDKQFMKGLLLGTIGLNAIQNLGQEDCIAKELVAFVKDIFMLRIGASDDENGTRYLTFKQLIECSCDEIRNQNYK